MTRRAVALLLIVGIAWGGIGAAVLTGFLPKLGLDLQGGISAILTAPEGTDPDLLEQAVSVMRNRIEASGVQEPEISIEGERNVLVQLPGVSDTEEALAVLGQTGLLSFRPVLDAAPMGTVDTAGEDDTPDQQAWLEGPDGMAYLVGPSELIGSYLTEAVATVGQSGIGFDVNLAFDDTGADLFAELTAAAANQPLTSPQRQIAIVLDGGVINAPPVSSQVSPSTGISGGRAVISMGSDESAREEAENLAVVLRYGSLPVELERSSLQKVSATLGRDSLETGVIAGLGGLAIVAVLLLAYYRALGLIGVLGLTVFGSLLLLLFAALGRAAGLTLTLAGVTGIIVSIGITADSYIVYFERVKEEIRLGHEVAEAVDTGFKKAYRTILTADFVTFMGAFLLWILAVGPVKGFAMALGIATILDLVIAKWYTRNAVGILAGGSLATKGWFSIRAAAGGAS